VIRAKAATGFLNSQNEFIFILVTVAEIQGKITSKTTDYNDAIARRVASGHPAGFSADPCGKSSKVGLSVRAALSV
jgi:hypothetical protein